MSKAVIQVKNRQYIVEKGSKIQCDRLNGEPGSKLELPILGLFRDFGKTGVAHATIMSHFLGEKRVVLHKSPRGHDRHRTGSRPRLTLVQIDTFEGVD
jgi:ribosomal protein L21